MRFILCICSVLIISFALGCSSAKPDKNDLKRVKKMFLQARFHSALSSSSSNPTDRKLWDAVCRTYRLDCAELMKLLNQEDPSFHEKLMQPEK